MTAAVAVGLLAAGGTYLVLQRERLRVVIGFVLLGHAVNVLFVATGGMGDRGAPLLGGSGGGGAADPLPQAFVLTAIVITFGITVYLLAMLRGELAEPPDSGSGDGAPPGPGDPATSDQPDDRDGRRDRAREAAAGHAGPTSGDAESDEDRDEADGVHGSAGPPRTVDSSPLASSWPVRSRAVRSRDGAALFDGTPPSGSRTGRAPGRAPGRALGRALGRAPGRALGRAPTEVDR